MESTSLADEARSRQMEGEFDEVPDSSASHFFVAPDPSDCAEERGEIAGVDIAEGEPESITRFLTLPTITARASSRRKDPLLDFTKSKILTSDEYAAAVQRLNDAKEFAAREKERMRTEKEALRQRKAAEKEARSVAIAEARARRVEEKEEAARLKALRTAEAAAARAAKASEKARRAFTNVRQTRREGRATETEQGHQITVEGAGSPRVSSEAQEPGHQDFTFNAGGIPNPYFSYTPPSPGLHPPPPGMQHPYFLPFNQFGNHVLSMSPNPTEILQPLATPHIYLSQGWAQTEGRGGEARRGAEGREDRAGRSR
jgi:hypothetical protein